MSLSLQVSERAREVLVVCPMFKLDSGKQHKSFGTLRNDFLPYVKLAKASFTLDKWLSYLKAPPNLVISWLVGLVIVIPHAQHEQG